MEIGPLESTHRASGEERGVEFISAPHIVHSTATLDLWKADFHDPEGNVLVLMSEVDR